MRLTWKDAVATSCMATIVAVYVALLQGAGWPVVASVRGTTAASLILGAFGGCAMGADPESSVTTPELRLQAHENAFVVDGSVLPTSLGVNPQLTIFALAHWAAEHVAGALRL